MADINDIQRYLGEETVHHHHDGLITRREMMQQLVAICGSGAAAAALLAACSSDAKVAAPPASTTASTTTSTTASTTASTTGPATTQAAATTTSVATTTAAPATTTTTAARKKAGATLSVPADDPAVEASDVTFPGAAGPLIGYLARHASATTSMPGIVVIHEIFGLTDHIRDVVRRLASVGYIALSVDLTSRAGGTAKGNPAGALGQLAPADAINDVAAALAFLSGQKDFKGKVGVTGFCYGGGMTLRVAANVPGFSAAVAYYGPTPDPAEQMKNATIPILAHYGANDARVNGSIAALEANVGGSFTKHIHDGAGHGFNNDTGGGYNETVAIAAWQETVAFFAKHVMT
jgi:carboxymethylenebutenolidase